MNCFCSTFTFQGLRIDEALRLYLEAFRLPGEAPVIQRLLETFTDNWHVRHISSTAEKVFITTFLQRFTFTLRENNIPELWI